MAGGAGCQGTKVATGATMASDAIIEAKALAESVLAVLERFKGAHLIADTLEPDFGRRSAEARRHLEALKYWQAVAGDDTLGRQALSAHLVYLAARAAWKFGRTANLGARRQAAARNEFIAEAYALLRQQFDISNGWPVGHGAPIARLAGAGIDHLIAQMCAEVLGERGTSVAVVKKALQGRALIRTPLTYP